MCPFFLAGGWKYESANDTCVLKIAKDSAFLLSSSDLFQSRLDSTLKYCNMEVEELKTAERQVLKINILITLDVNVIINDT